MADRYEAIAEQFRVHGYKLTQPRRAIVQTLLGAAKPLSPAEIQQRGQKLYHELGLVTVYRTLELMELLGTVRAVHLADGCHGFAIASPGHTHHVVCERCHCVVEIAGCDLGDFLDTVAERTGYAITGHWLEVSGLCAACQAQDAAEHTHDDSIDATAR